MALKTEIEKAREGEFLREYGSKYFIVVREALGIGRVEWEMVPIGKSGDDSIKFYLKTEKMTGLCEEISRGIAAKKIAADANNQYPQAYPYITGKDGCLKLNIGHGNKGVRIQMQDGNKKTSYVLALTLDMLEDMARLYRICTGITPVQPGTYYASVLKAFNDGCKERAKNFKMPENIEDAPNNLVDDDDDEPVEVAKETPTEKPLEKAESKQETAETKSEPTDKTSATPKSDDDEVKKFSLKIKGTKTAKGDFWVYNTDNDFKLYIRKSDFDNEPWMLELDSDIVANQGLALEIQGKQKDKNILYVPEN